MRAVGYRQIVGALEGACDLTEAIRLIKRDTRRYAKRQMTWFAADPMVSWIDVGPDARIDEIAARVMTRVDGMVEVS
jgi:tRNA dimethylallyltransferase